MTGTEVAGPLGRPPRSWAEDLNTYRGSRGCRSLSTLDQTSAPKRYSRTNYIPFADTKHPLYAYNEFENDLFKKKVDPAIQQDRCDRHGWNDTSLLKEDGYAGTMHPRGSEPQRGKGLPSLPAPKDGRQDLFGVLQMTEAGGPDAWIGQALIAPGMGKAAAQPPQDAKGRKDLFDVLHARRPGRPSDDSWLGHSLIDPAKGRRHAPGPEEIRGRRDLTEIISQGVLRDPNRTALLQKGADILADKWCGHDLIDPNKGKQPVYGLPAASEVMLGGAFKAPVPPGWSDFPPPHAMAVPAPKSQPHSAAEVLSCTATGNDLGRRTKREVDEPRDNAFDGRRDMYALLTFRPMGEVDKAKYSRAWDDSGTNTKRVVTVPGSDNPVTGPGMLHWKPNHRIGNFVPSGGMMQETRRPRTSPNNAAAMSQRGRASFGEGRPSRGNLQSR